MSGNCDDVLDDTDLLEEILVRVPHESIFKCILVSKRWFGLIRGSPFLEHYIRRWSDEANLLRLRLRLQSRPVSEVSELRHRLQSQQLAALGRLQPQSLGLWYMGLCRLYSERGAMVSALRRELQLGGSAEIDGGKVHYKYVSFWQFGAVNGQQRWRQSQVLGEVRELMRQLPRPQRLGAVNETLHQIVCELLVVVNEVELEQYRGMILMLELETLMTSLSEARTGQAGTAEVRD